MTDPKSPAGSVTGTTPSRGTDASANAATAASNGSANLSLFAGLSLSPPKSPQHPTKTLAKANGGGVAGGAPAATAVSASSAAMNSREVDKTPVVSNRGVKTELPQRSVAEKSLDLPAVEAAVPMAPVLEGQGVASSPALVISPSSKRAADSAAAPVMDSLLGTLEPTRPTSLPGHQLQPHEGDQGKSEVATQTSPERSLSPTAPLVDENGKVISSPAKKPPTDEEQRRPDEVASSNVSRKEMNEEDQKALDDAFENNQSESHHKALATTASASHHVDFWKAAFQSRPKVRGMGIVHPETPIPNADVSLRLLRKFATKTRPMIITTYGGTKSRGIINWLFGSSKEDPTFVPYKQLIDILFDGDEDIIEEQQMGEDSDRLVDQVFGAAGDSMARARLAVAAFVCLFSEWSHASSRYFETNNSKSQQAFSTLLSTTMDTASLLVAHGCLDGVSIGIGITMVSVKKRGSGSSAGEKKDDNDEDEEEVPQPAEYHAAVHMLAQSVFNCDLTMEANELAAMKFLLTTGCRQSTANNVALLHGSHLLQTIRTFYHIYLTTESRHNKTTARAALQQLIMSVFARMVFTDTEQETDYDSPHNPLIWCESQEGLSLAQSSSTVIPTPPPSPDRKSSTTNALNSGPSFPSENHRDGFLVLRSLCKLSMRTLPDPAAGINSHIGYQSSGSNETWAGDRDVRETSGRGSGAAGGSAGRIQDSAAQREHAQLVYTSAMHPALESKILALELLLYVLQNTDFSKGFIQRSGAQFHAAIRNYLCVSLLKNCTSDNTRVVNLSLRLFVPLVRNFRTILKNEIEAFVTNVFFVILDSKNSPAEHKSIVVTTFDEICSDPATLAEIFLNYDCDLSAVDLFHRIVNALSRVSRTGIQEPKSSGMSFMGGTSAARMEKYRNENRELRLDAMKALRQVLASLHASIVEPMSAGEKSTAIQLAQQQQKHALEITETRSEDTAGTTDTAGKQQNLVEIYGSKKKRRAEESEAVLRFNQKPSAGIAYAAKCGHIDGTDPADVARYLLKNKDVLEKTQIGEYLGREPDYQNGFSLKVLHEYVRLLDFLGLDFDDSIRFFLSGFRLPGEAQKIDRIMEKFAERYTEQNPEVFPTADVAFVLAFSIIMLNTDLHNPAIKEERRMTKEGFIRNNRGICDGQDLPEELLSSIFDRIKANPISLKEDDEARERVGDAKGSSSVGLPAALSPASFFSSHYEEMDRARETNFQKERDHIVRTTESLLKRRRHGHDVQGKAPSKARAGKPPKQVSRFVRTEDSGLRDEYVSPMFEVAWGPALAAFSTAMESANGTIGALIAIASDEELELAAENAAETIEVCLTGFRFAICTGGLCGNVIARDAFMIALSRFSQLGTGVWLEPRHIRCTQTMLSLAREDGELLGSSWEYVFRALSEINRFHQLFQLMARNDRAAAAAAERRRRRLQEKERKRRERDARRAAAEDGESIGGVVDEDEYFSEVDSLEESEIFSDDDFDFDDDLDAKAIDEANARVIYEAVSESVIEAIYERSSSLSAPAVKEFVEQLCHVSRLEISVGGMGAGMNGKSDLNQVAYRQQHALLSNHSIHRNQFHHSQPNIYNLQKLVEVTHYNMDSRPRLIFAELWAVVADHLTYTALHSNPALAMYAVDSFRQLSIQYLQREELEVFEFQRRFLKPLETVMAKSDQSSTKELLLSCIDRIIQVFGSDSTSTVTHAAIRRKGGLRSGWLPILTILGLGGRDADHNIAEMSYKILTGETKHCREDKGTSGTLLHEYFVEAVSALLMFVNSPHDDISIKTVKELSLLAGFLSDKSIASPLSRRKTPLSGSSGHLQSPGPNLELELWWPILLGLSRVAGDYRVKVRAKGLETLVSIINKHFFPPGCALPAEADNIQTLQLIFRGILTPMLEFAEVGFEDGHIASLPEDFDRFLTSRTAPRGASDGAVEEIAVTDWLETSFEPFMDACVSICKRSLSELNSDSLVEEIFAILNSCLLSDSGCLAVKGLLRLEQFVTSDLDSKMVNDDVWATVSHMLRRCLLVRGLPARPSHGVSGEMGKKQEESNKESEEDYEVAVKEFVLEDRLLPDRRYICSNAVMIVGFLLCSERYSDAIGLRWRVFLIAGLGRGIIEWEQAAFYTQSYENEVDEYASSPPDYRENAWYGRKWMNRFLLQLASMEEVVVAPSDADIKTNRFAAAQKLVIAETQRLLASFLEKERMATQYEHSHTDKILYERYIALVTELLSGYNNMDTQHLKKMSWINPVLLGSCIQSKNEHIRLSVQKLVQRTAPNSPVKPKKDAPAAEKSDPADGAEEAIKKATVIADPGTSAADRIEI